MNNSTEIKNEDEISLLDLFTVLLRYRKLIAGIILLFIMLSIAGYFIYPVYQYKKEMSKSQKQGVMQMEIVPKARSYVSQTLDSFLLRSDVIYESLYAAGMDEFSYRGEKISFDDENKKRIMYLIDMFWIKNMNLKGDIFIQKEYDKTFSVKRTGENKNTNTNTTTNTSSVFEITLKDKDQEFIKKFLESIYNSCVISVEENMRTNAQMMVDNYERIMNLSKISESMQMILERDFDTYVYLKDFLDGKEVVVRLISEPVFVESFVSQSLYKDQYFKTGIIIVFAGFFLAVMLAFGLNVVRNIKSDEEAMKKIRDALGASGNK
jgi:hypothetical protein